MLTFRELVDLERALRDRTVLSIYINGEIRDPANRRRWQLDLHHSLDDIESWLRSSSHAEREAFAKSRALVLERLESRRGAIGSPGWAGFFTNEGEQYTSPVPVRMPTMAVWSTGACVTPYIRALKESRPVVVVVVDGRKARLFRYVGGTAELVDTVRAHIAVEPPSHMGRPARAGFHMGTRGSTGADESQREFNVGTAHMLAETADRIAHVAVADAWVVVGGIPSVATALLARLSRHFAHRTMRAESLDVHATIAQVAEVAREAASWLRDHQDLVRVNAAVTGAESTGLGAIGAVDTQRALEGRRVRELYFTLSYLANHAADAESAVRMAFDNHALVEHVSGAAAARLEQVGGIAALLRYAEAPVPELTA